MAPVGPAALAKARGAAGSARPTRTARVIVADPGRLLRLLPAVAAASDLEHDPVGLLRTLQREQRRWKTSRFD